MTSSVKPLMQARRLNRRGFLAGSLAAAAAFRGTPAFATDEEIVVSVWGGSWEAAMRRAWFDPYTQKSGIPITSVPGNTVGKLRAMVESGRGEWDLIENTPTVIEIGLKEGLFEKLDYSIIDRSHIMDNPAMMSDYSVPQQQYGYLLAYSDKLENEPTGIEDLWDTKRFPGKRAFNGFDVQYGLLETALVADGVAVKDLYPLDVDRALAKMDRIRSDILWYQSSAQGEQFMHSGQAAMGIVADGRVRKLIETGSPIKVQPRVALLTWSVFAMPKGAKNRKAASEFLSYILTPQAQADICMTFPYGPVTPAAWDLIPPERAAVLSGAPQPGAEPIYLDSRWWSENLDATNEKFQAWRLG